MTIGAALRALCVATCPAVACAALALADEAGASAPQGAAADGPDSTSVNAPSEPGGSSHETNEGKKGLEHIVPSLENPWRMEPGRHSYRHRVAFSPGFGNLGDKKMYTWRFAYSPNSWLGWEAGIAHTPGDAVHAALHTLSAVLRYPLPWRLQPYVCGGYGLIMVFPGEVVNADPVTENVLTGGGGLELYIRDDLAIRGELRRTTVLGGQRGREGTVAYDYAEATLGFAFYRKLDR